MSILSPKIIAERGEKIYQDKLKDNLEIDKKGKYVAIEVETERYFIEDTPEEALQKAKQEFPDSIFYLIKIGYPGIYNVGWRITNHTKGIYGWMF